MHKQYDVIIMGGGMVGSAIACGLAQAGMSVAVLERQLPKAFEADELPRTRVSAISYASEQILSNLGAWNAIVPERRCIYRRLAVNELPASSGIAAKLPDISKWARTEFNCASIGKEHLGHIIENDNIQLALHARMADWSNIDVLSPVQVACMDLDGERKAITTQCGQSLEAKLVIGADGAQSAVRAEAGIGQFKEQYEQQAFVATLSYEGTQQDITWQSFTKHGPIAFLPLADVGGRHYASLVWYDQQDSIDQLINLSDDELLKHFQHAYPEELPKLLTLEDRARFPLYKSHALNYVKPGIALVGDAAHTINPLAGQGVNLGFMDAAVLIETLLKARLNDEDFASLAVLKRYEKSRRLANQSMMSLMDMFYYGFGNKHIPVRIARNLGLGLAQRMGFAKNKVLEYAIGMAGDLPQLARPA